MKGNLVGGALVTGGSSGIGLAIAGELAQRGYPVMLAARKVEGLAKAKELLKARFPAARIETASLDVTDKAALHDVALFAASQFGGLAFAVASAGYCRPALFLDQDPAEFEDHMQANFFGSLNLAMAAVPFLRVHGGHLVFLSSGAALYGVYGYTAYGASKFAVRGLAESLCVELAEDNIAVTIAYPPDTDTPQLHAELLTKPAVTRAITETSGVWQADVVARSIVGAALKRRFSVSQGPSLKMVEKLHSVIGPSLRGRQIRIARRMNRREY